MKISILTLFPEMFHGPFEYSIVKRAKENRHLQIDLVNIRDFGIGKHKLVDDTPFGGGIGMVLRVDVLHKAIVSVKEQNPDLSTHTVLLSAHGTPFKQTIAKKLASNFQHLIFICGHYEGFDERIKLYIDEEISVGDFITTGGEIPAMLITDAVTRLLPGVLKDGATDAESFSLQTTNEAATTLLEYPQYTQPREYLGNSVPEILVSGDHKKIAEWRHDQAEKVTKLQRPDLLRQQD
jgi:tRNA (guanine37-N1)-methyltransferase